MTKQSASIPYHPIGDATVAVRKPGGREGLSWRSLADKIGIRLYVNARRRNIDELNLPNEMLAAHDKSQNASKKALSGAAKKLNGKRIYQGRPSCIEGKRLLVFVKRMNLEEDWVYLIKPSRHPL